MPAIKHTNSDAVELPREPEKYRLTNHARNRFRQDERMINGSVIRTAIQEGDIKDGERPGTSHFVISFGALLYTIVVDNEPGSDGVHSIVTMFPNRR